MSNQKKKFVFFAFSVTALACLAQPIKTKGIKQKVAQPTAQVEPIKLIDIDGLLSTDSEGKKFTFVGSGIGGQVFDEVAYHSRTHNAEMSQARPTTSSPSSKSSTGSNESVSQAPAKNKPVGDKVFVCKIYCKSAGGPSINREFKAPSKSIAAKQAGDQAGAFCAESGNKTASNVSFSESQCYEK
jgi:hypothetical protein